MDFDNLAHWLIAIFWIMSLILVYSFSRKRGEGETLLSKLFTSNKDLDSTLRIILGGIVVLAVLTIVVMYFSMFHDDLEKGDVGMLGMHVVGLATTTLVYVLGNANGQKNSNKNE